MRKTRKKTNIFRRSFGSLRRHLAIVHTPTLLAIGTVIAALLALTFAFTSHAIFMLDVVATLILKAFLIHKTHGRRKKAKSQRKPAKRRTPSKSDFKAAVMED